MANSRIDPQGCCRSAMISTIPWPERISHRGLVTLPVLISYWVYHWVEGTYIYILFIIIYSLFNCILYQKALHLVDQWTSFKFSSYLRLFAPYRPMKRSGNSPWLPWFPGATRQLGSSCQNFGRSAGLSRAFFVGVSCMASLQNYDHSNYPLVN